MQKFAPKNYVSLSKFIENGRCKNLKAENVQNQKRDLSYSIKNMIIKEDNEETQNNQIIFHIDLDCFFAAVEARDNPDYRGKPLIIGADPKGGKGRGVVCTCSYEARKFGLHSAMPISQAYKLCPHGVYVRGTHSKYSAASKQVMDILKSYLDGISIKNIKNSSFPLKNLENTKTSDYNRVSNSRTLIKTEWNVKALNFLQASIDEAYLDFSDQNLSFKEAYFIAEHIKERVKREVGITCSIGVGPTKAIAKIASDHNKPDGVTVVEPGGIRLFLENLDITRISGIGKKSARYYNAKGIKKIRDFYKLGREGLFYNFGQHGLWIWDVITGRSSGLVIGFHERKSIGKERTFSQDVDDISVLNAKLYELNHRLHESMKEKKLMYKTVTLKLRFRGFETYTRSYTFIHPTFDENKAYKQLLLLLRDFYQKDEIDPRSKNKLKKRVRLIGVRFTGLQHLVKNKAVQATLKNYF